MRWRAPPWRVSTVRTTAKAARRSWRNASRNSKAAERVAGPIAVICAVEWELAHLQRAMLDTDAAVLKVCGIGMQRAAAAAQDLIDDHAPRAVLNYGCAGAHRADLLLGDIV